MVDETIKALAEPLEAQAESLKAEEENAKATLRNIQEQRRRIERSLTALKGSTPRRASKAKKPNQAFLDEVMATMQKTGPTTALDLANEMNVHVSKIREAVRWLRNPTDGSAPTIRLQGRRKAEGDTRSGGVPRQVFALLPEAQ